MTGWAGTGRSGRGVMTGWAGSKPRGLADWEICVAECDCCPGWDVCLSSATAKGAPSSEAATAKAAHRRHSVPPVLPPSTALCIVLTNLSRSLSFVALGCRPFGNSFSRGMAERAIWPTRLPTPRIGPNPRSRWPRKASPTDPGVGRCCPNSANRSPRLPAAKARPDPSR